MEVTVPYKNLTHTLKCLRIQVIDSLPYISRYIPHTIQTPEELFYFLKDNVVYKKDPKGVELLQTVQTLMKRGGHGDCDCFTILTLAACRYLNFSPVAVRIVGNQKSGPSHIYSLVWDEQRQSMCAMDLTNPKYCMERSYKYKQTLDFMILSLEDGSLSSRASRQEKRAERTQRKEEKHADKTQRKDSRQEKRTKRVANKGQRKATKQGRKEARQEKKQTRQQRKQVRQQKKLEKQNKGMLKVKGRENIINARQQRKLNKASAAQGSYSGPGSDSLPQPDEQGQPGSSYDASDATEDTDYTLMPDDYEIPAGVDFDTDSDNSDDSGSDSDDDSDDSMLSAGIISGITKGITTGAQDIISSEKAKKKKLATTSEQKEKSESKKTDKKPSDDEMNDLVKKGILVAAGGLGGFILGKIFK